MIKSMFSAVTGLKGHQTMLDVIGNNIANVNTPGFKPSTVLFTDLYYQTLASSDEPTDNNGGSNPQQVGYGSAIASIKYSTTRSGYQQTSQPLDFYISGEGFFTVLDTNGNEYYTRVGSLKFNSNGTLIDSNGNFVLGMLYDNTDGTLEKLTVTDYNKYSGIYISGEGRIMGTNNDTKTVDFLGQVVLATFPDAASLSQEGDMYYDETPASGEPIFNIPGSASSGALVSGGLEMSKVDLTKEFTDMIIAQRGFQANSRVITTSDEVLQELVNLKR